jgi:hypothetical protein
MDKLEYELVTLYNGEQYFVLESIMYEYDIYDLILNVENENDIKIVIQEMKNGKTVLNEVKDEYLLKTLSAMFKEKIESKQNNIN